MSIDLFPSQALTVLPPSGVSGQTQYNNAGVLAGSSGLTLSATQVTGITYADQAAGRTALGLGTLAVQNASAVAITGGSATGLSLVSSSQFANGAALAFTVSTIYVDMTGWHGLKFRNINGTDGSGIPVVFQNVATTQIGSITTSAVATAYNTTSDVRLKHAIAALAGALDVVAALRPVKFRWNADDSQGHGFLAHELQQTIPDAVTGLPDEVNLDGSIKPQQVDHSKIVPILVAAVKELLARVETLEQALA